ncbi:hypothetical protein DNTS_032486 [Danionella cerebrum]|uniref:Uncharacterized protein n=1 Tax=Danionella cerebrum TaxID=2873325 RepID=A0A553RP62_9TELE|nr:hypothetical protein DNTS_032486 [Danionella translucida]
MMAEDGGNISEDHQLHEAEESSSLPRTFIRLNDLSGGGERSEHESDEAERRESAAGGAAEEASASDGEALPYPTLAPVVICLDFDKLTAAFLKEGMLFWIEGSGRT